MRWMFALLGILLITSGAIVLGAPYIKSVQDAAPVELNSDAPGTRSFERRRPLRPERRTFFDQVRVVAEKVNAPLSILFGFMSLYYTRRTYHAQRPR